MVQQRDEPGSRALPILRLRPVLAAVDEEHAVGRDPIAGKRHFSLTIPGSPTGGPSGDNQVVYHDEMFSGEIGQIGTQLDGLGHIGVRMGSDDFFYNGFRRSEFGKAYGLEKLGIEVVILPTDATKFGAVESLSDAQKCADLFQKHREEIDDEHRLGVSRGSTPRACASSTAKSCQVQLPELTQ